MPAGRLSAAIGRSVLFLAAGTSHEREGLPVLSGEPAAGESAGPWHRPTAAALLGLYSSLALTVAACAAIGRLRFPLPDPQEIRRLFVVDEYAAFRPEPAERLQFCLAALLFPVLLLPLLALWNRVLGRHLPQRAGAALCYGLAGAGIVAIAFLTWAGLKAHPAYVDGSGFAAAPVLCAALALLALALVAAERPEGGIAGAGALQRSLRATCLVLPLAAIALLFAMNVFDEHALTDDSFYADHFNAFLHSIAQVHLGKTLLVDLRSQYGLYPEILSPLFRVTGLSVLKCTVAMSLLFAAALFAILLFLRDALWHKSIAMLGFFGMIYHNYLFARSGDPLDSYFQYHPLRFLFPAVCVLLAWQYAKAPTSRRLYCAGFAWSALAMLWNLDSAIPTFAAWLALLVFREFCRHPLRSALRRACLHLALAVIVVGAATGGCLLFLWGKSGTFPDVRGMLEYQRLFYFSGFHMLPMPLLPPWTLAALTYAAGFLCAFRALLRRDPSPHPQMLLFLSVLGVGVFGYYQGRSHDRVFAGVAYPMVLQVALFADALWRGLRRRTVPRASVCLAAPLLGMLVAGFVYVLGAPQPYAIALMHLEPLLRQPATRVTHAARFIREHTHRGEDALILSYHSGVFSLESGAACPLRIPGTSELFLRRDYDAIEQFLRTRAGARVFADTPFLTKRRRCNARIVRALRAHYREAAACPEGGVALFVPKE